MSLITDAFNIPINQENKEFIKHPYIPITPTKSKLPVDRRLMTVGRCFDIKYGSKNSFAPIYFN